MAAITTILRTKKKIKKEKKGQVRKENKYPNELYLRNEETGSENEERTDLPPLLSLICFLTVLVLFPHQMLVLFIS